MTAVESAVRSALHEVYDPCSVAAGVAISIVDMGLVTAVDVDANGDVAIALRPTSPMCTLVGRLLEATQRVTSQVSGVGRVTVHVDPRPGWTEADMTEHGRIQLSTHRRQAHAGITMRPLDWTREAGG